MVLTHCIKTRTISVLEDLRIFRTQITLGVGVTHPVILNNALQNKFLIYLIRQKFVYYCSVITDGKHGYRVSVKE